MGDIAGLACAVGRTAADSETISPQLLLSRSIEILSVTSVLSYALDLFDKWSRYSAECFEKEGDEFYCAIVGMKLLAALMVGNDGLRTMVWKCARFRRALRQALLKLRITREKAWLRYLSFGELLGELQISGGAHFSITEESIVDLNHEKSDEKGEGGREGEMRPIDVSHLLRASFWYVKASLDEVPPRLQESRALFYRWTAESSRLRNLCFIREFTNAACRAFADKDANEDALELFKMATSGWVEEAEQTSAAQKKNLAAGRLLAIQCTVSNSAVAKYVEKKKVKILVEMQRIVQDLPDEESRGVDFEFFVAWLEAATLRSQVNMDQCVWYRKFLPAIDLKKVPLAELFSNFQRLVEAGLEANRGQTTPKQGGQQDVCSRIESDLKFASYQPRRGGGEMIPASCAVCGERVRAFMYCGVCKLVAYCGKECQKKDWKRKPGGHKDRCALLKTSVTDLLLKDGGDGEGLAPVAAGGGIQLKALHHLLHAKGNSDTSRHLCSGHQTP
eukprot:Cvel_986.t2-p1 / transcript=Cvel_986.t2 / gene=Cvel_986 / organism=Chromera_velia_CCMP2878 / gene_product=hypothetical protein / transcript_product=hypothetical protein / location=Cvel_scaffold32:33074-34585(-) / protein_length=504 / sequence_SO=supercontig / SO=protein_coding / is_pseudo=false